MSYYAKVLDGIVLEVISADESFFETFVDTSPGNWLRTSYNTRENIHYGKDGLPDGLPPFRGNYAGIGDTYDAINDVFYSPSPFPSWVLDAATWSWIAPIPYPDDGGLYSWNETTLNWQAFN
jgi:hypothetical protein